MKPKTRLDGLLGATAFMAGWILVDGLADLINEGRGIQTNKVFEVQPQVPVTAAFVVGHCKHCGFPLFLPADREPHVLGSLCDGNCESANRDHYSDERDEDGFF